MERLFVDTSAWLAFANRKDRDHGRVRDALKRFDGRLVTSNFVFDETVTLCHARLGHGTALLVGGLLRDSDVAELVRVGSHDEREAWRLFQDRPDKGYSFTDCTSFALMQRLEIIRAATLDADFSREGFQAMP